LHGGVVLVLREVTVNVCRILRQLVHVVFKIARQAKDDAQQLHSLVHSWRQRLKCLHCLTGRKAWIEETA
jgi:hypothetical protein